MKCHKITHKGLGFISYYEAAGQSHNVKVANKSLQK
jgi:hypothetical protein